MQKLKNNEFLLLKSKDDYSFEHYKTSPLSKMTGFIGTAGEGIIDSNGHITLFVDPRYHIQADIQTKGKDVSVVKMNSQFGFIDYLKEFLNKDSVFYIPEKSTSFLFFEKLKKNLSGIKIKPYKTEDDDSSIDDNKKEIFEVEKNIAGLTVKEKIEKIKVDNFLITNLEHIAYILNLRSYKTNNTSTFRAKLFIKNKNEIILFCDYKIPHNTGFLEVKPKKEYEKYIKNIKNEINADFSDLSLYDYNLIQNPKEIKNNPIVKTVSVKNRAEINHYIDSFKRLDNTLFSFREQIKEGLSEFELNEIFEKELKKEGAFCTSFKTILAIGDNSSIIHYTNCSKDKILKKGDILLLDCGGYYGGGYATDITRTFWCKDKKAKDEIKKIYTAVLKAQLNVYHSEILMTDELHNLAVKYLKKYEKEGFYFPHGLGHGIGIPVHQSPPTLTNKMRIKIKNNNVFTIEPGLYKENAFGVRLENTVYLKQGKKVSLSHFPYEEDLIDYNLLKKQEKQYLKEWQDYYL